MSKSTVFADTSTGDEASSFTIPEHYAFSPAISLGNISQAIAHLELTAGRESLAGNSVIANELLSFIVRCNGFIKADNFDELKKVLAEWGINIE